MKRKSKSLVVIASTYPRWDDDKVPVFVEDFVKQMARTHKRIRIIAPHYKGAKLKEAKDYNGASVNIVRFRYFLPYSQENIAYGEFKKTALYPIKTLLYVWSELWVTFWTCVRNKGAIINAHWLVPQGFVAVLVGIVLRRKVIISIHGSDVFTLNGGFMRKVKRFALRHADAVVVNSSATRDACATLYERNYYVVPMGVDLQRFKLAKGHKERQAFELLFVGRVVEAKGIVYLCEAVKSLHDQNIGVHLNIVGDGHARKKMERYIKDNNLEKHITLVGWVQQDALAAYYEKADVFVGPSIETEAGGKEAFGMVFAEASAMGLPVITTNTGGIKDIVKHEYNGLIVPQKDSRAIEEAIMRLMHSSDFRIKLGKNGASYIAKNFAWDVVARKYEDILKNL